MPGARLSFPTHWVYCVGADGRMLEKVVASHIALHRSHQAWEPHYIIVRLGYKVAHTDAPVSPGVASYITRRTRTFLGFEVVLLGLAWVQERNHANLGYKIMVVEMP